MNALAGITLALLAYPGGLAALAGAWILGAPPRLPWRRMRTALLPLAWGLAACAFAPAPFSPLPGDWQHLAWAGGLAALSWIAAQERPSRRVAFACAAMVVALVALAGSGAGWRTADLTAAASASAEVAKACAALTLVLAAALVAGEETLRGGEGEAGVARWGRLLGCWAVLVVASAALLWPAVNALPAWGQVAFFVLLVVSLALIVRLSVHLRASARWPLGWAAGLAGGLAVLAGLAALGQ